MSTPRKLRGTPTGEPEPGLQQFKACWAKFSGAEQSYWREQFVSARTLADLIKELDAKHGIKLSGPPTLTKFRDWLANEDAMDARNRRAAQIRAEIQRRHPEWTEEQLFQELRCLAAEEALALGDYELGFAAAKDARETQAEKRKSEELSLLKLKIETEAAAKMLVKAMRERADEINASQLSQADKIAAMRQAAFADVEALKKSGGLELPK